MNSTIGTSKTFCHEHLKLRVSFFPWTNGDVYTGDWRDGVPQGHGEFDYGGEKDGERYVGQYDQVH